MILIWGVQRLVASSHPAGTRAKYRRVDPQRRVHGGLPRRRTVAALAAILAMAPGLAKAGCPADAPASPRLAATPVEARITYLRERLEAARAPAEWWTGVWGIIDGGSIVGQLAALPAAGSRSDRVVLAAGAFSGGLAIGQMVFLPVVPDTTPLPAGVDPCATLAILEARIERGARNQALGTGWGAQAGNVLVNGALGVLAALTAKDAWSGALTAGIGWAVGEAQLLTQPTGLVRDLARYRAGEIPLSAPAPAPTLAPGPRARLQVLPEGGALFAIDVPF